jgi:hypothetical protein
MTKFTILPAVSLMLVASASFAQAEPAAAPPSGPSVEQIFGFLDADKDGYIAKTEAQGPMVDFFAAIDADKDDKVSPAELQGAMDARAQAQAAAASAPAANPS